MIRPLAVSVRIPYKYSNNTIQVPRLCLKVQKFFFVQFQISGKKKIKKISKKFNAKTSSTKVHSTHYTTKYSTKYK